MKSKAILYKKSDYKHNIILMLLVYAVSNVVKQLAFNFTLTAAEVLS